jgi:hypothetical protein
MGIIFFFIGGDFFLLKELIGIGLAGFSFEIGLGLPFRFSF